MTYGKRRYNYNNKNMCSFNNTTTYNKHNLKTKKNDGKGKNLCNGR